MEELAVRVAELPDFCFLLFNVVTQLSDSLSSAHISVLAFTNSELRDLSPQFFDSRLRGGFDRRPGND
jgi:hypothetical protein